MENINLKKLREFPVYIEQAALWFSQKWGIPIESYKESMQECIKQKSPIPQWYIVLDKDENIIAGAGIIENDFHERKDLSPNLCALYVEEHFRNNGIAKFILDTAIKDLGSMGIKNLYLITDHTNFYEKCGWKFLFTIKDNDRLTVRMYTAPEIK